MNFGGANPMGAAAGNPGAGVDLMSWYVLYRVVTLLQGNRELVLHVFLCKVTHTNDYRFARPVLICYRYMEIPVVSRVYLTGAFLTTAGCAVDLISPFSLYFNWDLIFSQGQIWRLVTSYLFFGVFSVDFLFHMYFLVRNYWLVLLFLFTAMYIEVILLC